MAQMQSVHSTLAGCDPDTAPVEDKKYLSFALLSTLLFLRPKGKPSKIWLIKPLIFNHCVAGVVFTHSITQHSCYK